MSKNILFALSVMWAAMPVSRSFAENPPSTVYSQNREANDLFLKAHELFDKSDPRTGGKLANAREAIKLYEQAVAKDPKFTLAYVELSRSWLRLGYSDPDGLTTDQLLPAAKAAALKAVEVGPESAEAHQLLAALSYSADFDWETAEREYKVALRLQPDNATSHANYAAFLSSLARFPEALEQAAKAEQLEPSLSTDLVFCRIHYSMKSFDKAADYCGKSLARRDNVLGHFFLGLIQVAQKQYDKAMPELEKAAVASNNGGALAGLAYGSAMAGKKDRARELLEKLNAGSESGLIVPYRVAAVHLALGDKDQAIEWLRKSYAERDNWMTQLKVDPVMDPLRSDPRFQELMQKMRFNSK
jgi:tetratricopeptide (TPR) repeat protein